MPEQTTVFYQLPRGVVIRHWRRRTLLDRRQLLWRALALLVAPGLFLLGGGLQYLAYVTLFMLVLSPIRVCYTIASVVDANPILTLARTVTFGPSGLAISHAHGKSEVSWNIYSGLSEDSDFFYLHFAGIRLDSILPKSAFTEQQQSLFRQYANNRSA